jgi:nucleoside-diphosphate-sugar epimerase
MGRKLIVCVTGAAGRIAYSLFNTLCTADIFGHDVDIVLRLI